jgi:hypothetical protein
MVSIRLQYCFDESVFCRSAISISDGNPRDQLMKQTVSARKGEDRRSALVRFLLAAIVLLIVPDDLLREGHISMAKIATAAETQKPVPQTTTPPARDPRIAVEEEYQIARQQGTAQALELFIQRHPDDPLAEKAHADLRRMSR